MGDVEIQTEPRSVYGLESSTLGRTIERELVPRLLLAHRAGPLSPAERSELARRASALDASAISEDDLFEFVARVLGVDEDGATDHVRTLVTRGVTIEAVYVDLLAPTANALGQMWSADTCDFMEVAIGLGRMQRVLRELSKDFVGSAPTSSDGGRVLLSCIPGEQHTLGLYMVAEFFIRDGWGVSLGAPVSDADLVHLVSSEWFDVVGFSAACDTRLIRLRREIASVRRHSMNRNVRVLVGGRLFVEHPHLVDRIGADACVTDAREGPTCARGLVPTPSLDS